MPVLRYLFSFVSVLLFSRCTTVYEGQVVSELTGEPLKGVTLTLQNYELLPSIVIKSETDSNGKFKLVIPASFRKYVREQIKVSVFSKQIKPVQYQINKSDKQVVIKLKPGL